MYNEINIGPDYLKAQGGTKGFHHRSVEFTAVGTFR